MTAPTQGPLRQIASAEVFRVDELVQYQSGAVVSRTLIKHKEGTITAFAFDRGQGLSEHTAAFDALVEVIDGTAEFTISGTPFQLHGGDSILLPANQPHAVTALTPFKMLLTMIRSERE